MRNQLALICTANAALISISFPASAMCTRLPLSDVALSRPAAISKARKQLRVYAIEKLRHRGWTGKGKLFVSRERIVCTPYVSIGSLAAGHRCLVTSTFCTQQRQRHASAIGQRIRLRLRGSEFEISGILKRIDKTGYIITPPNSGNVTVPTHRFECISDNCPKLK